MTNQCETCQGEGIIEYESGGAVPGPADGYYQKPCDACDGTGEVEAVCDFCGDVMPDATLSGGLCSGCAI